MEGLVLVILAGIAKAVKDVVDHSFSCSVFSNLNRNWWDHSVSWNNKHAWRRRGVPFATTALVFFTDAWHFFQLVEGVTFSLGFYLCDGPIWMWLIYYIIARTSFELSYRMFKKC